MDMNEKSEQRLVGHMLHHKEHGYSVLYILRKSAIRYAILLVALGLCVFLNERLTAHSAMCDCLCGGEIMATNLELDDRLIKEALTLGNHRTKKAAVTQALTDYIRHLRQERILELFGKVDFDPAYDYKRHRARA